MISESVQHRPAPALRPLVAWYSGYRQAGLPPGRWLAEEFRNVQAGTAAAGEGSQA